jgi:hypothetical protein
MLMRRMRSKLHFGNEKPKTAGLWPLTCKRPRLTGISIAIEATLVGAHGVAKTRIPLSASFPEGFKIAAPRRTTSRHRRIPSWGVGPRVRGRFDNVAVRTPLP